MGKLEGYMYLALYFVMLIFGGITVISTNVLTAITTLADPFTSFIMFMVSIGIFFGVIPYMIYYSSTKETGMSS
ncbi:MAG: hypothetical protein DRN81_02005 [Thermoproteota archaeon]|nr:MAG: hypothetical protein DRN81_02005 [Candidatus Korarchaeota archaeon]